MLFAIWNIVFIIISFIVISRSANIKDVIGFPENEENPLLINKQNRTPVFLPSLCPENELYYPGDQIDDWICDCRPGYIFHPESDKCWLAYDRGPCAVNQYLILPQDSMVPVCLPNACRIDSMVLWNGRCAKLGSPCGHSYPTKVVWVNAVTLDIECVNVLVNSNRIQIDLNNELTIHCPLGCRRNIQNKCKPQQV